MRIRYAISAAALSIGVFGSLLTPLAANAAVEAPTCMSRSRALEIDNAQALNWKFNTANQFKARARIAGYISSVYTDRASHEHIQGRIGDGPNDTIELIYNKEFGALPENIRVGATFEACGDYITAFAPSGRYQASPDGAIIHWLHYSPRPQAHDHGYLTIDGVVYGQSEDASAENRPPQRRPSRPRRGEDSQLNVLNWF